jgi:hypothetical protein
MTKLWEVFEEDHLVCMVALAEIFQELIRVKKERRELDLMLQREFIVLHTFHEMLNLVLSQVDNGIM